MQKLDIAAGTVEGFEAGFYGIKRFASITIEGTVRISTDGNEPDASFGHKLTDKALILQNHSEIVNFRAHSVAGAVVTATFI